MRQQMFPGLAELNKNRTMVSLNLITDQQYNDNARNKIQFIFSDILYIIVAYIL